jgi:hypothetical protein
VVRVHRAGDDGLPEARAGIDDGLPAATGHRVGGEEHAGDLRVDHALDHHGQSHAAVVDAVGGSIGHGTVGPQRCPAAPHGVQHGVGADDIQVGVLLAGEAREG